MIIPLTGFYILCLVLIVILLLPFLYFEFVKKTSRKILFVLPAMVVPFIVFTPFVIEVDDCEIYSEKAVVFPEGGLSRGRGHYLVNNSQNTLYIAPIVYGNSTTDAEAVFCLPGDTLKYNESVYYIFEEAPDSITIKGTEGAVRYELGCIPSNEEQLQTSLENTENYLKDNPDDVQYLFYKGSLLYSLGRIGEAEESFRQATQADSKTPGHSLFSAYSYGRLEEWEPAISIYEQYLDSTEVVDISFIHSNLGFCYMGKGDRTKAKSSFEEAAKESEENTMAYVGLAMLAAQDNDATTVKENLDRLWELRPDYTRSFEAVSEMEYERVYFSPTEKELLRKVFDMYNQEE